MKPSIKEKIQESIKDLEAIGGLKDPEVKKVIAKLKKAIKDDVNSKK